MDLEKVLMLHNDGNGILSWKAHLLAKHHQPRFKPHWSRRLKTICARLTTPYNTDTLHHHFELRAMIVCSFIYLYRH